MDKVYSTPISHDESERFQRATERALGQRGLSFEEVTIAHLVNYGVSDVNNNPSSPFEGLVFQFAADDQRNAAAPFGPRAASIIRRTQSPIIDGSNKIPGALALGIFGVAAVVDISDVDSAIDAVTLGQALQKTLGKSVLRLEQGGSRIFELRGKEFMSYGDGQRVDGPAVGEDTAQTLISSPVGQLVGRKVLPTVLGAEQELKLSHFWDRTTAANPAAADPWPAAFQVLYLMPGLIARKR